MFFLGQNFVSGLLGILLLLVFVVKVMPRHAVTAVCIISSIVCPQLEVYSFHNIPATAFTVFCNIVQPAFSRTTFGSDSLSTLKPENLYI